MITNTEVVKINEKLSYIIIGDTSGVVAVERSFKGVVRVHVLIDADNALEIANELTASKESWKEVSRKYDLPMYSGKS